MKRALVALGWVRVMRCSRTLDVLMRGQSGVGDFLRWVGDAGRGGRDAAARVELSSKDFRKLGIGGRVRFGCARGGV